MKKSILLAIAITICSLFSANAQWRSTGPAGFISSVVSDGDNLYAGTNSSILYISKDDGATWSASDLKMPKGVNSITYFNNNLYLAGSDGVYISEDKGKSAKISISTKNRVFSIVTCDNYVFASSMNGIIRTSDEGKTWSSCNAGLSDSLAQGLQVVNHIIYASIPKIGIVRSSNYGASWQILTTSYGGDFINSFSATANKVCFANPKGVFLSENDGLTWNRIRDGVKSNSDLNMILFGDTIIIGVYSEGLYKSVDKGKSWKFIGGDLALPFINGFYKNDNKIFATTYTGINISETAGDTWSDNSDGINNTKITTLYTNDATSFAGYYAIYKNNIGSAYWSKIKNFSAQNTITNFFKFGDKIFLGSNAGYILSSDNGDKWTVKDNILSKFKINEFCGINNSLFAATNKGIYKSLDTGASWTQSKTGIGEFAIQKICNINSNLFALKDGSIYKSIDLGEIWTKIDLGTVKNIISICGFENSLLMATNESIYISNNNGDTWSQINSGTSLTGLKSLYANDKLVLANVSNKGAFILSAQHKNIFPIEESNSIVDFTALSANSSNIFGAGNEEGLFEFAIPKSLEKVTTLLPVNNSTKVNTNPIFSWNKVPGAAYYRIQISDDAQFSNIIADLERNNIQDTLAQLELNKTYYWRVRGEFAKTIGEWNEVQKFSTGTLDVNNEANEDVNIAPNPSSDLFVVNYNLNESLPVNISVYDGVGVQQLRLTDLPASGRQLINTTTLASGSYNIVIESGTNRLVYPVIVIK